jgi:hypothetical protein
MIEGRAIYGNLENKINTLYWPVENSIPKNNDRRCAVTKRCKRKITECQWAVLNLVLSSLVADYDYLDGQ